MLASLKKRLQLSLRFSLRDILKQDDCPRAVALGVSVGIFIGMTPTVGGQMAIVLLFAWMTRRLFRFNRPAALMAVYVSNPFTILPLYYAQYRTGAAIVGGHTSITQIEQLLFSSDGCCVKFQRMCVEIGSPLLVGTAIFAVVGSLTAYPATQLLLHWYHSKPAGDPASCRTPEIRRLVRR